MEDIRGYGSYFYIVSAQNPNLVIDVNGASKEMGAKLIVWDYHGADNQKFRLNSKGYIESIFSGLVLDVSGGPFEGRDIIQWELNEGENQRWKLHPDGTIRLLSNPTLCVDIAGGSKERGANLCAWRYHGGLNQKWRLIVINAPIAIHSMTITFDDLVLNTAICHLNNSERVVVREELLNHDNQPNNVKIGPYESNVFYDGTAFDEIHNMLSKKQLLICVITNNSLKSYMYNDSIRVALKEKIPIVLVHLATTRFPSYNDQPSDLTAAGVFDKIAVSLIPQYGKICWEEITEKVMNLFGKTTGPAIESLETDMFLSHRQKDAQGIAHALFWSLTNPVKDLREEFGDRGYNIFLDVHAKFDIHNLELLVSKTKLFVLIITPALFESEFCYREFKTAKEVGKKIIIVQDASYSMREEDIVEPWKEYAPYLMNETKLFYAAKILIPVSKRILQEFKKAERLGFN